MSRLPPIPPHELSGEQKQLAENWERNLSSLVGDNFVVRRSDGAWVGLLAPLLHTPNVSSAWFEVSSHLKNITSLPPSARETAILVTGTKWKAVYEIYAHERIALAGTSLTEDQINDIKVGVKPESFGEVESIAFDVATELLSKMGPLSNVQWERAAKAFGKDGAAALVHYVGYYSHACLVMNGCDVELPEGENIR